jgi:hypothetical protein
MSIKNLAGQLKNPEAPTGREASCPALRTA